MSDFCRNSHPVTQRDAFGACRQCRREASARFRERNRHSRTVVDQLRVKVAELQELLSRPTP